MRVLLIEDDVDLSRECLQYLTKKGHDVLACGTLAEAREALKRSSVSEVNTVICDMNLPDGKGIDLCLEMAPQRRDLHWVLISGALDEQEIETRLRDVPGPRRWRVIEKPFSLRNILTSADY